MSNLIEDQKMIQHEIHDEMKNSYIDYAMSVIAARALPDVRDGTQKNPLWNERSRRYAGQAVQEISAYCR